MHTLLQDLSYGLRTLASKRAFTLAAVLSLALGIGLNTAIFTLVNSILLRSLPYRDPDRLVMLSSTPPDHPDQLNGASVPDFFAWKERARSFEFVGGLSNSAVDFGAAENGIPAERVQGEFVTPGMIEALGVRPARGRLFTEAEDEVDHPARVIVISHRLWMRRFGAENDILGRQILINGEKTEIVGVMPPGLPFHRRE